MDEFDIYIGAIADDRAEPPAARFARAFGLPEPRAREFVASLPRVVKRSVTTEQAERYAQLLHEIGAAFELRRSPIRPVQTIGVAGGPGSPPQDEELDEHGAMLALPELRSHDPRGLRFSATVVGGGLRADEPLPAPPRVPEERAPLPAWNPTTAPTLRESRPPPPHTQQTLREAALADVFAMPYAAPRRSARVRAEAPPAPAAAPPEAPSFDMERTPAHQVWSEAVPAAHPAWAPTMPAPVPAPARAPSGDGGSPAAPPGQAPWLALGADKYLANLEQLSAAPPAPPLAGDRAAPAGPSKLPARPPGRAPFAVYSTGRATPAGVPLGRESRPEPPFLLRLAMRVMLGGSLFLMITSVRHCHVLPTDVEDALAGWQAGSPSGAAGVAALGPIALDWLVSDLHQVTGGDKDRARGIASRLKDAGAVEVYVGSVMNAGAVQLAGELLVELPTDEPKREAVLAAYAELMSATFGGAAVAPPDEKSSVLRIVL